MVQSKGKTLRWMLSLAILLALSFHASKGVHAESTTTAGQASTVEETLTASDPALIDQTIAAMSDEQVRRLLIEELKTQARQQMAAESAVHPGGIGGFIERGKNLVSTFTERLAHLRAGDATSPTVPTLISFLGDGERQNKTITRVILSVAAVLMGGLLIEWLFVLYTRHMRRRITTIIPAGWGTRLSAIATWALMNLAAVALFIVATVALFYFFLDRSMGQRLLLAAYLLATIALQVVYVMLNVLLAPRVPALRILPMRDTTAVYLQRWVLTLTFVYFFGNTTATVMRLAGAGEWIYFQARMIVSLLLLAMFIAMVIGRRKAVAASLTEGTSPNELRNRLGRQWHIFAITGLLVLFIASVVNGILGLSQGRAILTLLMVPLYFLLDWLLRLILEAAFGIMDHPEQLPGLPQRATSEVHDAGEKSPEPSPENKIAVEASAVPAGMDFDRLKGGIRIGLRLALAALLVFWTLDIWNIRFEVGQSVARAAFNILIVVLIFYVIWCLINAAIQRRLYQEAQAERDDDEGEAAEGSAGGSRMATLLVMLRKFMLAVLVVMTTLVVLSSLGVDIAPLIAGAGVIGLAIGFGAQTLVKDIISGMFFLLDDAFRVGDYVECGGAKGMVEHISVRSLRIRHPRGMVNFIPFGDLNTVTNFSRDYIITKLDFRVGYDADQEKIRKIIKKKVSKVIEKDPELGPKLMGAIKSQGVRQMDDSAMIMRIKYKTKPGDQFAIRKEVYRLVQESFREAGIEFAHRNVTVYIPPEVQQGMAKADNETSQTVIQSGAAGAMAAIQADEANQNDAKQS